MNTPWAVDLKLQKEVALDKVWRDYGFAYRPWYEFRTGARPEDRASGPCLVMNVTGVYLEPARSKRKVRWTPGIGRAS